jgi:hypothetical protein
MDKVKHALGLLLRLALTLEVYLRTRLSKCGSGVPPPAPAPCPISPSFHLPENPNGSRASANLFQGRHPMSRSVWTAPYSGALTSGVPHHQRFCNRFTQALQTPAHLAAGPAAGQSPRSQCVQPATDFPRSNTPVFVRLQPTDPPSSCHRQMPFHQHLTTRHRWIMSTSGDTLLRVLPASTHWHSARYQRCNPRGVCPVRPGKLPPTSLTSTTPTDSNALHSTQYAPRNLSDFVQETGRMGGQTPSHPTRPLAAPTCRAGVRRRRESDGVGSSLVPRAPDRIEFAPPPKKGQNTFVSVKWVP